MDEITYSENSASNFRILSFATGEYYCICSKCGKNFLGDKRSRHCLECTILYINKKIESDKVSSQLLEDAAELLRNTDDGKINEAFAIITGVASKIKFQ